MSAFLRFCARRILPLIADIEVRGDVSRLPKGGYMFASNHLGRLDSLVVYYVIDNDDLIHPLTDKYKKYWWGRLAGKIFNVTWLTRGEADLSAMKEFISRLKNGAIMIIAPEGTRSKTASLLKAEPGAIYIASAANVGIIPVALTGTEDACVVARLKKFKRLKITISTGEKFIIRRISKPSGARSGTRYCKTPSMKCSAELRRCCRRVTAAITGIFRW